MYCVSLTPSKLRPAGGNFTVEIAANRAFTTLSYEGRYTSNWGDGQNHPSDYVSSYHLFNSVIYAHFSVLVQNNPNCIGAPNSASDYISMRGLNLPYHQCTPRIEAWQQALHSQFLIRHVCNEICTHLLTLTFRQSDLAKVTQENLVVFTVRYQYVYCLSGMAAFLFRI